MRMWMVDPRLLCRNHLLGEHKELHMLLGCMKKGKSITGYLERDQLFPGWVFTRHEELVKEIIDRGYNHNSPMICDEVVAVSDSYSSQDVGLHGHTVDWKTIRKRNLEDLEKRCPECAKRMRNDGLS